VTSLYQEPAQSEVVGFGALEFHDVFRIYRSGAAETVALRGLDLRVEPRELVALYGPSGSGKSTALHLAAALDEPSAGEVRAFGSSLTRLGDAELASYRARTIAIVFQSGNLWTDLSARENVALGLRLAGRRRKVTEAVDRALDAFDLQRREDQPAGSLSGGEQQRVAIARALVNRPRVLLADEPTGNLDTANSQRAFELLQNIVQQGQKALLLATHNPVIAEACDWIHEMQDGRIIASHPRGQRSLGP